MKEEQGMEVNQGKGKYGIGIKQRRNSESMRNAKEVKASQNR